MRMRVIRVMNVMRVMRIMKVMRVTKVMRVMRVRMKLIKLLAINRWHWGKTISRLDSKLTVIFKKKKDALFYQRKPIAKSTAVQL